jgi:Flp pilus assembly protein TadD
VADAAGPAEAATRLSLQRANSSAGSPPHATATNKPANRIAAAPPPHQEGTSQQGDKSAATNAAELPTAGGPIRRTDTDKRASRSGAGELIGQRARRTVPSRRATAAFANGLDDSGAVSPVRPIAVVEDPEIERLMVEAWGLIHRGDYGPSRLRLKEAQRVSRDDPRAHFSLGLLDAVVDRDWRLAEDHFAECVRCDPENVPSLNNLAVAKVHNRDLDGALRHWKAILTQDAATVEIVQNLGCVRYLAEKEILRVKNSLAKSLDTLYTDAAIATDSSFEVKTGFHLMALTLPDGRLLGWADARKLQGPTLSPEQERDASSSAQRPRLLGLDSSASPSRGQPPASGDRGGAAYNKHSNKENNHHDDRMPPAGGYDRQPSVRSPFASPNRRRGFPDN